MKLSYKDAVKTIHQEQQTLFHHMEEAKRSGYICPSCGNGSGSDGTGIALIKGKGHLFHCHRCGWNGDIIAYIEKSEGLKHIEAVKMLLAELGHELDSGQPDILPEPHTEFTEAQEEPKEDYSKKYPYWHKCALEGTETALYMESRGISRNTWEKYGIGYCQESKTIVFPCSKHAYVERFIDPKTEPKYKAHGSCNIWNGQAVGNDNKVMFITEGILDALSVIECGYDALAIRSANTAQKAGKMLAQSAHAQQKVFCIITDSDSAGIKAGQDLQDAFTEAGILWRNEILTVVSPCKDANERLLQDPEGLRQALREAYDRCLSYWKKMENEKMGYIEKMPEQAQQMEEAGLDPTGTGMYREAKEEAPDAKQDPVHIQVMTPISEYINNEMQKDIEDFRKQAVIRTGFDAFDKATKGGLYSGLYVISAGSGLGKSTLCLQMADQIAERGKPVLYFSLEQSRFEMASKSIARTIFKEYPDSRITALDIRKGVNTGTAGKRTQEAIAKYTTAVSDRLAVIECPFGFSPDRIRKEVSEYIAVFDKKPVCFIDYLQVLSCGHARQEKRQEVDAIVTQLKQLSRDYGMPVIVVSSLNRQSYREKVSFEGLKESGTIEYSADCVLGMQYTAIENAPKDADKKALMEEEAKKSTREVCLTVLKNRYGSNFKIYFAYTPHADYFREEGNRPETSSTAQKKQPTLL